MLKHPAAPALVAAILMLAGYATSAFLGEVPIIPPSSIIFIMTGSAALVLFGHAPRMPVPTLSSAAILFLRIGSLVAVVAEIAYFGVPLFGGVAYNEFGWPVVHHLAVMQWMLVLFGEKRKLLDLGFALTVAALLFNRQIALFAILAYVMTTPIQLRRLTLIGAGVVALVLALGELRNQVQGIDTGAFQSVSGLTLAGPLYFVYLYLLGPLHIGLGITSDLWDVHLAQHWNTIPEWAWFSIQMGFPPAGSFVAFYGMAAMLSVCLRRSSTWHFRILGTLIHIYTYFSFFSGVLLSTPIIANYLGALSAAFLVSAIRAGRTSSRREKFSDLIRNASTSIERA